MRTDSNSPGRVVVIHNTAHYIALHYIEFIQSLVELGYEVHIIAPEDEAFQTLSEIGARCHDFPLTRRGMNPLTESYSLFYLWKLIRKISPRVLFNYSTKPIIYGSFVARLCRIPDAYSMVTGLGYMFSKDNASKQLVLAFYKLVLRHNTRVFFQNAHDREVFVTHRLLKAENAIVVNGTGINLEQYHAEEVSLRPTVFLLMSRMLWEKGIEEFVVAARELKASFPQARFQLLGPVDDNPSAIPIEQLKQWDEEGAVEYLGETDDVRPFLARATVFVHPSYYREGRPRSILEAMATGKPIITTDWPGCREPVAQGVNGFLIPIKSSDDLRTAMVRFLVDDSLAQQMGNESRRIVEQEYDVRQINNQILSYFPGGEQH